MANAWKKESRNPNILFLFLILAFSILIFLHLFTSNPTTIPLSASTAISKPTASSSFTVAPFDCAGSPQAYPVIANIIENLDYPFLYSLPDFGSLPDKPHKNIVRFLKGKPFRRPDISATVQNLLLPHKGKQNALFVDVGANVGMAAFAASAMGFRVMAFEPVLENLQKLCDGIWFNRASEMITIFQSAVSDRNGNLTFHKLVGRLDNSAVSAAGAKLAFKSNEEIAIDVRAVRLDDMVGDKDEVVLLKIDVQGWEYHVLRGASRLLSRKKGQAPFLIYEEDEKLLQASNTTAQQIREFLRSVGYNQCTVHGSDAHCKKD